MADNITSNQTSGGYDNTIVAVFDSYSDAKRAMDALNSGGCSSAHARLTPQSENGDIATDSSNPSDSRAFHADGTTGVSGEKHGGIRGFFDSLFGRDEHREHHEIYSESIRRGHYVLTYDAQTDEELQQASNILHQCNPIDIDERSSVWKQQGWKGYDASAPRFTQDEITRDRENYAAFQSSDTASTKRSSNLQNEARIPVVEENLKVGKREVDRGGVRVFKRVTETPVNESIQLRDEHVKVERRPASGSASIAEKDAFKEESFELRESAEEPVVSKEAHVVEEVVIGKEVNQRTENITDNVRRTDVEVEQLGGSSMREGATRMDDDSDYRNHWQTNYGSGGGRYEDYAPAYSYGSTLASSDRYRDRNWEEVEPQARSDWETSHPGSTWEKVKDAVRYGTERISGKRPH